LKEIINISHLIL
jgi:hypothetical protein